MSLKHFITIQQLTKLRSAFEAGNLKQAAKDLNVPKTLILAAKDFKYREVYILPKTPKTVEQLLEISNNNTSYAIRSMTGSD